MTEEQVAAAIAETLKWAARQASLPAITDIEIADGEPTVILLNSLDGAPFSLTIEAL